MANKQMPAVGISGQEIISSFPDLGDVFPEIENQEYAYRALASIGVMCILGEVHQIMTGLKPGNQQLALEDYQLMSRVLQRSLSFFQQYGHVDHFFNLNGQPIPNCPALEPTLVDWNILTEALGLQLPNLESATNPEIDNKTIYIATVGIMI